MNNIPRFNECLAYINCQLKPSDAPHSGPQSGARWRAVTISREAGCDASTVADCLKNKLQASALKGHRPWTIFDQNLLELVLADHHLSTRIAQFMPEASKSIIADMIEETFGLHPPTWILVRQTAETVLRLAELGNVIFIGRGANIITKALPSVFHVRLIGSLSHRVARVQVDEGLDYKAASKYVLQKDQARASFVKQHFKEDIANPALYHLTINTDTFSVANIAEIISHTMLMREASAPKRLNSLQPA